MPDTPKRTGSITRLHKPVKRLLHIRGQKMVFTIDADQITLKPYNKRKGKTQGVTLHHALFALFGFKVDQLDLGDVLPAAATTATE